jgi:hypothetical protein
MNRTPVLADPRALQPEVLMPSPTQIVLVVQTGVPGANTRKFTVSHNYFFIKDLQRL